MKINSFNSKSAHFLGPFELQPIRILSIKMHIKWGVGNFLDNIIKGRISVFLEMSYLLQDSLCYPNWPHRELDFKITKFKIQRCNILHQNVCCKILPPKSAKQAAQLP